MPEKTIEGVAIQYVDNWVQRKKIENHNRNSGCKDNFCGQILWKELL